MKITVKDMCLIAIFTAVIAALAQLTIPVPGIPLTMQTFAVPLAGAVLGAKKGALSAFVYILLGAMGAPVFHAFQGGIGMIAGPTGGFILAFPLYAFIVGFAADKNNRLWLATGLVIGMTVLFLLGGIIFPVFIFPRVSFQAAFLGWVLPFLLPDLIKIIMVYFISIEIKKRIWYNRLK